MCVRIYLFIYHQQTVKIIYLGKTIVGPSKYFTILDRGRNRYILFGRDQTRYCILKHRNLEVNATNYIKQSVFI